MFQKLREGKNIKDIGPDADELLAQCGVVLSLVQVRGSVVVDGRRPVVRDHLISYIEFLILASRFR